MNGLRESYKSNRRAWIRALRTAMPGHRVEPGDTGSITIYPAGVNPIRYNGYDPNDPIGYTWGDYGDYRGRAFGFHAVDGPSEINTWLVGCHDYRLRESAIARPVAAPGPTSPFTPADVDAVVAVLRAVIADAAAMDAPRADGITVTNAR